MNLLCAYIYRAVFSAVAFMLMLSFAQSVVPKANVLSNAAHAKTSKPVTSPYKKSFSRSKRVNSTKSRRRSSSGSCVNWDASKINQKALPYNQFIDKSSRKYRVDKNLIKAVITAESCFKVKARSPKNAQGLMQLIPATAERFGVTDSYIAQQNIRGGTRYLRFLLDRFNGDMKKVIASYNAGEGAVDKYKGIPPYKETIQYVKNVMQVYSVLQPPKKVVKKPVKVVYKPPQLGRKAGRQGWQYNRSIAPHLYKQ